MDQHEMKGHANLGTQDIGKAMTPSSPSREETVHELLFRKSAQCREMARHYESQALELEELAHNLPKAAANNYQIRRALQRLLG